MKKFPPRKGKFQPRPLHKLRALIDSKRIEGNPGKFKDLLLKKLSNGLGRTINIQYLRPQKGKKLLQKPFTGKNIVEGRKVFEKE